MVKIEAEEVIAGDEIDVQSVQVCFKGSGGADVIRGRLSLILVNPLFNIIYIIRIFTDRHCIWEKCPL